MNDDMLSEETTMDNTLEEADAAADTASDDSTVDQAAADEGVVDASFDLTTEVGDAGVAVPRSMYRSKTTLGPSRAPGTWCIPSRDTKRR